MLLCFIKCSRNGNRDAWTWCPFDGWQTGKEVKDITVFIFLEERKKDFWYTSVLPGKFARLLALHFKCYGAMITCSDKATLKYIINDLLPSSWWAPSCWWWLCFCREANKINDEFFLIVTMIILILSIAYNICLDTYNDKKFLLLQ